MNGSLDKYDALVVKDAKQDVIEVKCDNLEVLINGGRYVPVN
ncbi:hypothetical protein [Tuanshanicoccus yangjingiae]